MTVTTCKADAAAEATAAPIERPSADHVRALRRLQREMLELTAAAATHADLLARLADLLQRHARLVAFCYCERSAAGELAVATRLPRFDGNPRGDRVTTLMTQSCHIACSAGELDVRDHTVPPGVMIAAPVPRRGHDPHALAVMFAPSDATLHLVLLVQMVVSHLVLWDSLSESREREAEARDSSALVELLEHVVGASDSREACYALAGDLSAHLGCRRVLVGLRPGGAGRCRLAAISGVAQFDARSETARAIEAAMDEAVVRDEVTRWPSPDDRARHAALAHKKLALREEARQVVGAPLRCGSDPALGAILVLDDSPTTCHAAAQFLRGAHPALATALGVAQRLEGGRAVRWARAATRSWRTWKGRVVWCSVAMVLAGLLLPWWHKVHADCRIEPVTRRFVAAPFEGTLEQSFVKPGDIVRAGEILARIDGREIRWKHAAVVADHQQAKKKRDVAQAAHNYADQQIAQLEMERLELELRLLDHRAENLEIRSPIDGIIASGDLERAEGAPLRVGQTLFEVGPLERMIVEIAIPDAEIAFVREGQAVDVRLDAYPGESWQATVVSLHPRSEIRDNANVFVAEAELDNTAGRLRPGMKGRARIAVGRCRVGWILFHKPWEHAVKKLAW